MIPLPYIYDAAFLRKWLWVKAEIQNSINFMNSKICYLHLWFWHCAANVIFSNQPVIENISSHVFTSISIKVWFKARPIHRFTYRNTRRITLKARAYLLRWDTITKLNHVEMETEGLYNTKFGTEWYWSGAIATYRSSRLRPATLLKKKLWHRYFPVNFVKFLITSFYINHLWWLLLNIEKKYLSSFPIKTIKQIIFCSVVYEKKRKNKYVSKIENLFTWNFHWTYYGICFNPLSPSHRSYHKPDLQLFKDRARYGYFPGNFPTFSEQRL